MTHFTVTGMTCAACSARVEKAVKAVDGVSDCAVNLLTGSMSVEGGKTEEIIRAVQNAGYGAFVPGEKQPSSADRPPEKETARLTKRLIASAVLLAVLMVFSMGPMAGLPLPSVLSENYIALALIQLLLTASILLINHRFFVSGYKALWRKAPNMDSLVALGASAAFLYSLCVLFLMSAAAIEGDAARGARYLHELYFESAASILTLITVGKALEARAKGKTTSAIEKLMSLSPDEAVVLRDGKELTVPTRDVKKGERFIVRPGSTVPVDGIVLDGETAVNESALTGESLPVDKKAGDAVSAGTVNLFGFITCEASRVGEDTTLSQIIRTVNDAAATKAPIAKTADRVSGVFVPVVMAVSVLTAVVWLLLNAEPSFAIARGISVLVISCPCALGLATPVAIMVGSGVGAKNGILFKTAEALEQTGKTGIAVLDKTGTVTEGKPFVTDILPTEGTAREELLSLALSLEKKSEHPIAGAVVAACEKEKLSYVPAEDFEVSPGGGVRGRLAGKEIRGGNRRFLEAGLPIPDECERKARELSEEGKTPVFFASDGKCLGIIAVSDVIKPDSAEAVRQLKEAGLRVVLLTGDNEKAARAIARQAGIDEVIANVLPVEKQAAVEKLKQQGKVLMIGDGINDAPALTAADTGMAIGAGADIAIDSADVVLTQSRLSDAAAAVRLSRATLRNIRQNLFWAFFYNSVGIPLAAGVLMPLGLSLRPTVAAAAMSLSSFCVVSNALRLNLFKPYKAEREDRSNQNKREKEKNKMEMLAKTEGMMCVHCEAHVKKAVEALDGVESVTANHTDGTVVIRCTAPVSAQSVRAAIEAEGYKVLSVE